MNNCRTAKTSTPGTTRFSPEGRLRHSLAEREVNDEELDEDPAQARETPGDLSLEVRLAHLLRRPRVRTGKTVWNKHPSFNLDTSASKASALAPPATG